MASVASREPPVGTLDRMSNSYLAQRSSLGSEPTDVHETVLLGRHSAAVAVTEQFPRNRQQGCACIAWLPPLMKKQFSANRQASKNNGIPYRLSSSRVWRIFSIDTGWPPPLLLVMVIMTSGMFCGLHDEWCPRADGGPYSP